MFPYFDIYIFKYILQCVVNFGLVTDKGKADHSEYVDLFEKPFCCMAATIDTQPKPSKTVGKTRRTCAQLETSARHICLHCVRALYQTTKIIY